MATIFQQGIDVSQFQGTIRWPSVAAAGIQFAVLRAAVGAAADTAFARNWRDAADAGVRTGAYWYTLARTDAEQDRELERLFLQLQGKKLQYPVFVDFEDRTLAALGRAACTRLAKRALRRIADEKYLAALYTYDDFARVYLDMNALGEYPFWLAEYAAEPTYAGRLDMWQYTDRGRVNGIAGRVDKDASYKDFLPEIQQKGLNNYAPPAQDGPQMYPLSGVGVRVFGTKNCQYFFSADVDDVAGSLPNGTYRAVSQSYTCYGGWPWLKIEYQGAEYWTALIPDRNTLVAL